jgi:hypothetical protein
MRRDDHEIPILGRLVARCMLPAYERAIEPGKFLRREEISSS